MFLITVDKQHDLNLFSVWEHVATEEAVQQRTLDHRKNIFNATKKTLTSNQQVNGDTHRHLSLVDERKL